MGEEKEGEGDGMVHICFGPIDKSLALAWKISSALSSTKSKTEPPYNTIPFRLP